MRKRVGWLAAAASAAVLAVGCQGTPDSAFNAGAPVLVPSWSAERGPVLRLPGGSMVVSRYDIGTNQAMLRKLNADGTLATTWGTGGDTVVPFVYPGGSGATEGVALADGSVILRGYVSAAVDAAIRITPTGAIDGSYGSGGQLTLSDGFSGTPYADTCSIGTDGTITCATSSSNGAQIALQRYSATGQDLGVTNVPVDLSSFVRSGGEGSSDELETFGLDVVSQGSDTLVAVQVRTLWGGESSSETDVVVLRIRSGAVDTTFGASGYQLLDLEVDGSGLLALGDGEADASLRDLTVGTDGAVTAVVSTPDGPGPTFGIVRLTPTGVFDAAAAGGGLWTVTLPDGTHVDVTAARVSAKGVSTLGGNVPDVSGTRGVVVRYTPVGAFDPNWDVDGVVDVPGSRGVHGLDNRNGRVTVGGSSSTIGGAGEADVVVQVLTG